MTRSIAFHRLSAASTLVALWLLLAAASAHAAATASVSISGDPTEDKPVTVTISGTTSTARTLYTSYTTSGSCGSTYASDFGSYLGSGRSLAAGSYSESYTFTPIATGTYRICAWVASGTSAAPDATVNQTFTTRSPAAVAAIAISADPTEDEPVTVTISGTTEVARTLYTSYTTSGSCGSTYASDFGSYLGSGRALSAGAYSESFSFTPIAAGTYRVCAWVAETPSDTPDATADVLVGVRRLNAAVAIAIDRAPYLLGERRTATITANTEGGGKLSAFVTRGASCPAPDGYADGQDIPAGGAGTTVAVDPGKESVVSVCAQVVRGGQLYAQDQATLTLAPVPIPAAAPGSPSGRIDSRRPTFAWDTVAGNSDDFVLTDREGVVLMLVGKDGAWVPNGDDTEENIDDADDYYDDETTSSKSPRAGYEKLPGAATYRVVGGRTEVRPRKSLPPGSYRWLVERRRSDGQTATSATKAFKISGPALSHLKVKVRRHATTASAHPGFTSIGIDTTPYAYVRLELRRAGRTKVMNVRWSARPTGAIDLDWSCKRSGGTYSYKVTVTDDDGHAKSRRGTLRTITKGRCAALRAAEKRARDQRVAARRRRQAAAERRRQAAARADLQRRIDNCHAIDGVARRWTWPDGSTSLVCVSPYGVYAL